MSNKTKNSHTVKGRIVTDPKLRKLFKEIEDEVGVVYDIAHAHGGNAFRPDDPQRVDEGWGLHFENIKLKIKNYLNGGAKAKPQTKKGNRSRSKHN